MSFRTLLFPWIEVSRRLLRPLLARHDENQARSFLLLLAVVAATWWVTVPVHELLHAAGCVISGGSVEELTVRTAYGGGVLEKIFPFVRAGGDYAGQLTRFDTRGSDLCYFVTDFFPFLLTVFLGVSLLVLARRRRSTVLHGVGFVQTLLPVVSIPGDFYEMGSILMTRFMGLPTGSAGEVLIRGDDFFLVLGRVRESAGAAGVNHATIAVLGALGVGVVLHFATLDLSLFFARIFERRKPLEK